MKLNIFEFRNGKTAYTTGELEIETKGVPTRRIETVEVGIEEAEAFIDDVIQKKDEIVKEKRRRLKFRPIDKREDAIVDKTKNIGREKHGE